MLKSVTDYLHLATKKCPKKIAIVKEEQTLTFFEMKEQAESISSFILENLHIYKTPIVVLMDKNISSISCFMGIALSHNIYVPVDVNIPRLRLESILEILDSSYIITDKENISKLSKFRIPHNNILLIEELILYPINNKLIKSVEKEIIDVDPLYIIFTSGSTGIPKGVTISHKAVIDFTEECSEIMDLSDKEIFLSQAPFYFDASVPDIYCMLRNAATLHIVPKHFFSFPIKLMEYMDRNKINAIFWVPSALILVANFKILEKFKLPELKKVMFCGEIMPIKQLNIWRKAVPHAMYVNYYGPSEATYASTYYIIDREFKDEEILPIGHAANNTGILVLNEQNERVNKNEVGELYIQGSGIALGYYNNEEKTKEFFVQNPLHNKYTDIIYKTGDLVKINNLNEIIYIGRKDFQIKHRGYRIELGEIEIVTNTHKKVENCCCIYEEKQQKIFLFIQTKENIQCLKSYLTEKLPVYMLPDNYVLMEKIPLNSNGKIDRKFLKNQISDKRY